MSTIHDCFQTRLDIVGVHCDLCILQKDLIAVSHEIGTQARQESIDIHSSAGSIVGISIDIFTIVHIRWIISEDSMKSHCSSVIAELNGIDKRLINLSLEIPLQSLSINQVLLESRVIKLISHKVNGISLRDKRKDFENQSLIDLFYREISLTNDLAIGLQIYSSTLREIRLRLRFSLSFTPCNSSIELYCPSLSQHTRSNLELIGQCHSNTTTNTVSTRGILKGLLSLFEVGGHMCRGIDLYDMTEGNPSAIILYSGRLIPLIEREDYMITRRFFLYHLIDGILEDLSDTCFPSHIPSSTNVHTR